MFGGKGSCVFRQSCGFLVYPRMEIRVYTILFCRKKCVLSKKSCEN